jgi:hypothetical protein
VLPGEEQRYVWCFPIGKGCVKQRMDVIGVARFPVDAHGSQTESGGEIKISPFLWLHKQAGSQVLVKRLSRWH